MVLPDGFGEQGDGLAHRAAGREPERGGAAIDRGDDAGLDGRAAVADPRRPGGIGRGGDAAGLTRTALSTMESVASAAESERMLPNM